MALSPLAQQRRQRLAQPEVVQGGRAQVDGGAVDVAPDLAGEALQPLDLPSGFGRDFLRVEQTFQPLEAERQAGHRLADLVVQLAGDPALFVLLRLAEAAQQVEPLRLGPLARLDVRDHAVDEARGGPLPKPRRSPGQAHPARHRTSLKDPELHIEGLAFGEASPHLRRHPLPVAGVDRPEGDVGIRGHFAPLRHLRFPTQELGGASGGRHGLLGRIPP